MMEDKSYVMVWAGMDYGEQRFIDSDDIREFIGSRQPKTVAYIYSENKDEDWRIVTAVIFFKTMSRKAAVTKAKKLVMKKGYYDPDGRMHVIGTDVAVKGPLSARGIADVVNNGG
jgi:hypothetical protein